MIIYIFDYFKCDILVLFRLVLFLFCFGFLVLEKKEKSGLNVLCCWVYTRSDWCMSVCLKKRKSGLNVFFGIFFDLSRTTYGEINTNTIYEIKCENGNKN